MGDFIPSRIVIEDAFLPCTSLNGSGKRPFPNVNDNMFRRTLGAHSMCVKSELPIFFQSLSFDEFKQPAFELFRCDDVATNTVCKSSQEIDAYFETNAPMLTLFTAQNFVAFNNIENTI